MKVTLVVNVDKPEDLDLLIKDLDIPYYAEKEDLPKKYKELKRKLSNIKNIVEE